MGFYDDYEEDDDLDIDFDELDSIVEDFEFASKAVRAPTYARKKPIKRRSHGPVGEGPCPKCGGPTTLRINRALGIPFYGCVRFPDCRGSRDYDIYSRKSMATNTAEHTTGGSAMSTLAMNKFSDKLMNRFFQKVNGVVWDLMSGKVGIRTNEGIATLDGEGEDSQISINMIEQFGIPVPAFAQSTPVDQIKVGDLIYTDGKPKGWVITVKEPAEEGKAKKFSLMSTTGSTHTWTPPKLQMLGFDSGVMVLKSLIQMLPNGKEGLEGMQGTMMPLLMMFDGDDLGSGGGGMMDKIMPMMLMSQMNGGAGGNNMVQTMMLMQMMGGRGGFGNFFDS